MALLLDRPFWAKQSEPEHQEPFWHAGTIAAGKLAAECSNIGKATAQASRQTSQLLSTTALRRYNQRASID